MKGGLSRLAALPAVLVAFAGLVVAIWLPWWLGSSHPSARVNKIISLSPSTTETIFALGLGEKLVGVSTACDYPEAARALPKMGDYGAPAVETILAKRPDLIVASGRNISDKLEVFRRAGIRVYIAPDDSIDGIARGFAELGAAAGAEEAGRKLADEFRRAFADGARRAAALGDTDRPVVFLETWDRPVNSAGRGTFLDEVINSAGGHNLSAELGEGYFEPAVETVIRRDPQVIVLAYMRQGGDDPVAAIAARPGWAGMRAVKDHRVWADINPDWLLRAGPRLSLGLDALRKHIDEVRAAGRSAGKEGSGR